MSKNRVYWRCARNKQFICPARVIQNTTTNRLEINGQPHNHTIGRSILGELLEISYEDLMIVSYLFRQIEVEDLLRRTSTLFIFRKRWNKKITFESKLTRPSRRFNYIFHKCHFRINSNKLFYSAGLITEYTPSTRGNLALNVNGHRFHRHDKRSNRIYWRCSQLLTTNCLVRATQDTMTNRIKMNSHSHNHGVTNIRRKWSMWVRSRSQDTLHDFSHFDPLTF